MRLLKNLKNKKPQDFAARLWDQAERNNQIEKLPEQEVFHISEKEAKKCRFNIINMDLRMAECSVHSGDFSHGVKLHPPHLWNIDKEGKVFYRQNMKSKWLRWLPAVKANKERLADTT